MIPRELIDMLIWQATVIPKHVASKPGEFITRQSELVRDSLSRLKSDDIANIRPDYARLFIA